MVSLVFEVSLNQWFPTRDHFVPWGRWQYLETVLIVTIGEVQLASCRERPGLLLNSLQWTAQPPRQGVAWLHMLIELGGGTLLPEKPRVGEGRSAGDHLVPF